MSPRGLAPKTMKATPKWLESVRSEDLKDDQFKNDFLDTSFESSQTWLFQAWLFAIFTWNRFLAPFCAFSVFLRSFPLLRWSSFVLVCAHLHLSVSIKFRATAFGNFQKFWHLYESLRGRPARVNFESLWVFLGSGGNPGHNTMTRAFSTQMMKADRVPGMGKYCGPQQIVCCTCNLATNKCVINWYIDVIAIDVCVLVVHEYETSVHLIVIVPWENSWGIILKP